MEKQEFLEKLQAALNGKVPANVVIEHRNYYEDYINTEVRKGRSQEEGLASLGDPRLIARTIVETSGSQNGYAGGSTGRSEGRDSGSGRSQGDYTGHRQEGFQGYGQGEKPLRRVNIPAWAWLVIGILVVVLVLSVVFSVIAALIPIVLPILLVLFAVKLFRDWIN